MAATRTNKDLYWQINWCDLGDENNEYQAQVRVTNQNNGAVTVSSWREQDVKEICNILQRMGKQRIRYTLLVS